MGLFGHSFRFDLLFLSCVVSIGKFNAIGTAREWFKFFYSVLIYIGSVAVAWHSQFVVSNYDPDGPTMSDAYSSEKVSGEI